MEYAPGIRDIWPSILTRPGKVPARQHAVLPDCSPIVGELRDATGETGQLSVRENGMMLVLRKEVGSRSIRQTRQVRKRGYATELNEINEHAGCIAAPAIDGIGCCVAAISIVAPEHLATGAPVDSRR